MFQKRVENDLFSSKLIEPFQRRVRFICSRYYSDETKFEVFENRVGTVLPVFGHYFWVCSFSFPKKTGKCVKTHNFLSRFSISEIDTYENIEATILCDKIVSRQKKISIVVR